MCRYIMYVRLRFLLQNEQRRILYLGLILYLTDIIKNYIKYDFEIRVPICVSYSLERVSVPTYSIVKLYRVVCKTTIR